MKPSCENSAIWELCLRVVAEFPAAVEVKGNTRGKPAYL